MLVRAGHGGVVRASCRGQLDAVAIGQERQELAGQELDALEVDAHELVECRLAGRRDGCRRTRRPAAPCLDLGDGGLRLLRTGVVGGDHVHLLAGEAQGGVAAEPAAGFGR